jgi:hypothetical protein
MARSRHTNPAHGKSRFLQHLGFPMADKGLIQTPGAFAPSAITLDDFATP